MLITIIRTEYQYLLIRKMDTAETFNREPEVRMNLRIRGSRPGTLAGGNFAAGNTILVQ